MENFRLAKSVALKRVAFLGRAGHTLPSHRALLNYISREWSVTVYGEVPFAPEWLKLERHYRLRLVVQKKLPRRLRDVVLFFALARDHFKSRYHIVHAHSTYPTGLVAVAFQMLLGVPAIVSLDAAEASAFPEIGFGDLLSARRRRLNCWVIQRAKVVTALTEFQRKEVVENLEVRREVLVIPRGVDPEKFFPQERKMNSTAFTMLNVGYLNAIKDPETLLYAFVDICRQKDCQLIIVGRDYTQGAVQRLVKDLALSDKVQFEGHVENDSMPAYYRRADILIHSARYESQGMAVAEAMACGVVVVGTKVGLISDLAADCCIAVEPGDADGLARAVLNILSDEDKMARIRKNALDWSRANTLKVSAHKLMNIYQQLAESR